MLSILLVSCATAVGTSADGTRSRNGGAIPSHDYTLAFLVAGERAGDLADDVIAAASLGHRAHIETMGAEGTLLLAGPFGEPRANTDWRGIYVLDLADVDAARDLTRSDPSVVAGLFDLVMVPWQCNVDLRPMRDKLEQEKKAGIPFNPAAYVLATRKIGPDAAGQTEHWFGMAGVVCAGELGGGRDGEIMLLLTAKTVEGATEWLARHGGADKWELSSLWATALLGEQAASPR
ncbi:MAG: hypothetical protein ACI9S9_001969 [Planctomycetota bacterium]|jgi:uncharacterized protein YciI